MGPVVLITRRAGGEEVARPGGELGDQEEAVSADQCLAVFDGFAVMAADPAQGKDRGTGFQVQAFGLFGSGVAAADLFSTTGRTTPEEAIHLHIQGGVGEIDIEQRTRHPRRQPDPVPGQGFIVGQSLPLQIDQRVRGGQPEPSGRYGILPLVDALYAKGMPMGTLLAFMMATVALSLPEMILLRRVLKPRLIATFAAVTALGIVAVGYLFNAIL